jgi:hypothetical protein
MVAMGVTVAMAVTEVVLGPAMSTRMTTPPARRNLMINIKVLTWSLGLFAAVSFVLCVVYGVFAPESLHMHTALETVLPGFRWLTFNGFFVGLVESFLYGVYGGLVFGWIYNGIWKLWGSAA